MILLTIHLLSCHWEYSTWVKQSLGFQNKNQNIQNLQTIDTSVFFLKNLNLISKLQQCNNTVGTQM